MGDQTTSWLRSLTGHTLRGASLVRLVYLDEAGISKTAEEPYLVVAAVIVHADNETGPLSKELKDTCQAV